MSRQKSLFVAAAVAEQKDADLAAAMDKGVDFVFDLLEERLGVSVSRDAATETWDGDVSSVLGRILEAAGLDHRGAVDVLKERHRQIDAEGFDALHDDMDGPAMLAAAAGCYLLFSDAFPNAGQPPPQWPWEPDWWKPKDFRRDALRGVAVAVAAIEAFDRHQTVKGGRP